MKSQLTILIPTRNRRDQLIRTLDSIRLQNAPEGSFDVVVVSDGSTDGTKQALGKLAEQQEWSGRGLICIEQEWAGAAAARNRALHAASGDLVLFLDDDVTASPDLVATHLAAHRPQIEQGSSPGTVVVVLGRIVPVERPEAMHRQMRVWWQDHYMRLSQTEPTSNAFFTGNVSLPRKAALDAGGFDESLDYGEDIEFGYRLGALGLRFQYEPQAVGYTPNPKPAVGLLRDLYRSGQGSVRIYRKLPGAFGMLPLSAFGETNIRMRVVRGLLLRLSENRALGALVDGAFSRWAGSKKVRKIDRQMFELARSYYFWLGVRAELKDRRTWARLASPGVPVLTYHSVEPVAKGEDSRYTVDPAKFAMQMRVLKLLRYKVVPLSSLVEMWRSDRLAPARAVGISFDDGYTNNLDYAWPILRKLRYNATLFFVTGLAGKSSIWDEAIENGAKPLLNWDDLRKLDRQGFHIEAHTVNHKELAHVPADVAGYEIGESRRQLQRQLGRKVELFAYPYGHHNRGTEQLAEAAGYKAAFTVARGLNTPRTPLFRLKRVTISGDDNIIMFALKIWAGDDPLCYIPVFRHLTDRKHR